MSFVETDTAAQERFNLLLLEPGEIYFEDFSVYYYPDGATEDDIIRRKQRGHLKVCSKSLVFVPKEAQFPILKFPLRFVQNIEEWTGWTGRLFSKLGLIDRMIQLVSSQAVAMKEKNIISPYNFIKEKKEYRFSLNYGTVDDCLPQICQLHRASTLPPADQSAMINAIVLSRRSRVSFNTSWLEDLYEKIVFEAQGDKISPLVTNPGRIMLTSSRLYFQPFNNIESVPVIKIRLRDIVRLCKRRFLLRQIGLEIFCADSSPHPHLYLALSSPLMRQDLYDHMLQQPELKLEESGQDDMTLKWQSGHISNFDYLLSLNSNADRSFSDLTQYPVMPWIIQDYTSPFLDLNNPDTFRDLSKPIGALNEERIAKMRERYKEMPEPKFLYGSHYSTPGYVLFYLARIVPEYVLCLQNGRFDQPDRMFNSVFETWQNCLQGAADFKELIPEFYDEKASSDFLYNKGLSNFGIRQDGRPIGDVELPPWATNPEDFLSKLRQAMECEYVSQHLNEWIDLIFGYKQRGEEAVKADNVFYYMTYEGAVDLESITDPNERAMIEIQIMEFGQVPKQLFTTPHPQRFSERVPRKISLRQEADASILNSEGHIKVMSAAESKNMVKAQKFEADGVPPRLEREVSISPEDISCLSLFHQYAIHKETITDIKMSSDNKHVYSVSQDKMLKMYSLEDQRQLRSINISSMALSSLQVMPDDHTLVVGSWDNKVYFYSIEFGRVLDSLSAHDDAVSSVLWSNDMLLTASWDSTVKVWQFSPPSNMQPFKAAEFVCQLDHDDGVNCQYADEECAILVTGTTEGQVAVWDIAGAMQIAENNVHIGKVMSVILTPDNRRVVSSGRDMFIRVIDIETGTEIFVKDIQTEFLCTRYMCGQLLAGTSEGELTAWDMDRGQQLSSLKVSNDAVTCLDVKNNYVLTAGKDKAITVWKL